MIRKLGERKKSSSGKGGPVSLDRYLGNNLWPMVHILTTTAAATLVRALFHSYAFSAIYDSFCHISRRLCWQSGEGGGTPLKFDSDEMSPLYENRSLAVGPGRDKIGSPRPPR